MNHQNRLLDIFKLIAAIFVCFIHYGFQGKFGIIVNSIARFSVPLFFIVSGWYAYLINSSKKRINQKIIHILQIAVLMEGIYFIYHVRTYNMVVFSKYLSWKALVKGISGFYGITGMGWFVYSLMMCYVTLYFLKSSNQVVFYKLAFVLMIIHVFLNNTIMREIESAIYVSNTWLMGIPFFYLGMWMRENEKHLKMIKLNILLFIIFLGMVESVIVGMNLELRDMYVGSIFISASLIIIAHKYDNFNRRGVFTFLAMLGKHLTTYIYLIHLIVRDNLIYTFEQYDIILGRGLNQITFIIVTISFSIFIEFAVEKDNSLIVKLAHKFSKCI